MLIVDQSLRGLRGHHFAYDMAVAQVAQRQGVIPLVVAHESFAESVVAEAPVIYRTRMTASAARRSRGRQLGRDLLRHLPAVVRQEGVRLVRRVLPAGRDVERPTEGLGRAVVEACDVGGLGSGDHVLVHTVVANEILGLLKHLGQRTAGPRIHVVLRYDESAPALDRAFMFARTHPVLSEVIKWWTDTDQLAEYYGSRGARIGVLPIPVCPPDAVATQRAGAEPLRLAFLGDSRGDKGFHLLPGLASQLGDRILATGRARLVVQASYGMSREEPVMADAHRALRRLPASWISLHEGELPSPEFDALLRASDLLLLPYSQEIYRRRSSGLLIQAAAAGIPTVVPAKTWLATAAPHGASVTFGHSRTLADACEEAIERYDGLKEAAREAMEEVRVRHNADRLVSILLQ